MRGLYCIKKFIPSNPKNQKIIPTTFKTRGNTDLASNNSEKATGRRSLFGDSFLSGPVVKSQCHKVGSVYLNKS